MHWDVKNFFAGLTGVTVNGGGMLDGCFCAVGSAVGLVSENKSVRIAIFA